MTSFNLCSFPIYSFLENFEKRSQNISRRVFSDYSVFLQSGYSLSVAVIMNLKIFSPKFLLR